MQTILHHINLISPLHKKRKANKNEEYARDLIERAFHEDGLICIDVTVEEIKSLIEKDLSLRSMLLRKVNELRFGR